MRSVPLVADDSNIDLNKHAAIISIEGRGLIRMKTSLMSHTYSATDGSSTVTSS